MCRNPRHNDNKNYRKKNTTWAGRNFNDSTIKYSNQKDASNHEDATWRNKEDEDMVDIPKIEEPITAKIRTQIQ